MAPIRPKAGSLEEAISLHQAGKLNAAEPIYRKILSYGHASAEALNLLGVLCTQTGRAAEAVGFLAQAVALAPAKPDYLSNLGVALRDAGRWQEALEQFGRAIALRPSYAEAHANQGLVLLRMRQFAAAEECFRRAIRLNPRAAGFHNNLGTAARLAGRADAAVAAYQSTLALDRDNKAALYGLALSLEALDRRDDAVEALERAVAIDPSFWEAQRRLGVLLSHTGRPAEALPRLEAAAALKGDDEEVLAGAAFVSSYVDVPPAKRLALASAYGDLMIRRAGPQGVTYANTPDPDRLLRVGLVSGDLTSTHAVGQFLPSMLSSVHERQLHVTAYSTRSVPDPLTRHFHAWHEVGELATEDFIERVREDGVDILVDLSGLTAFRRHDVFARHPVPVQATWFGYSGTTGLDAIDYIIADRLVVPPGDEALYAETVWRMPDAYLCWTPPAFVVLIEKGERPLTFGSYNKINKISDEALRLWGQILCALPESRLVLKSSRRSEGKLLGRVVDRLSRLGVAPERIELLDFAPPAEHLRSFNKIDIALDPFPYNGTTTTMEALWMGVPVLSLAGEGFVERVGLSILETAGLSQWIAATPEEYVEKALRFARDPEFRQPQGSELRARVVTSALCDGPRFARNFEAALRGMWRRWCESQTQ